MCLRLKKVPNQDLPFLFRAIFKYFPDRVPPETVDQKALEQESLRLFRHHPEALEAVLSIYQL